MTVRDGENLNSNKIYLNTFTALRCRSQTVCAVVDNIYIASRAGCMDGRGEIELPHEPQSHYICLGPCAR